MRALWLVRPSLQEQPGGDTTQILETAAALRRNGHEVVLTSDRRPDFAGFDLVHLFHLDRGWENAPWCRQLRHEGLPAVLSPIYWPTDEFDRHGRAGFPRVVSRVAGSRSIQDLRLAGRAALPHMARGGVLSLNRAMFDHDHARRFVLDSVDALLPNSRAERDLIEQRFATRLPIVVVPNAADAREFSPAPDRADARTDTVLCVGRIEPRKNQLTLVRALRDSGLRVRIAGQPGRFSRRYARMCRREAGPEVSFLGWRDGEELRRLYRESRVHVSASWYETPGIASLEAARSGCSIVVTEGGSTREYFGGDAEYCRPDDPASVRAAIAKARHRSSDGLVKRVADEFTWERAAALTLDGYARAIESRRRSWPVSQKWKRPPAVTR